MRRGIEYYPELVGGQFDSGSISQEHSADIRGLLQGENVFGSPPNFMSMD